MPKQMGSFLDDYMTGLDTQGDPMDTTGFNNNPDQQASAITNWDAAGDELAAIPGNIVGGIAQGFGDVVSGAEGMAVSFLGTVALLSLGAFLLYEIGKEFDRA